MAPRRPKRPRRPKAPNTSQRSSSPPPCDGSGTWRLPIRQRARRPDHVGGTTRQGVARRRKPPLGGLPCKPGGNVRGRASVLGVHFECFRTRLRADTIDTGRWRASARWHRAGRGPDALAPGGWGIAPRSSEETRNGWSKKGGRPHAPVSQPVAHPAHDRWPRRCGAGAGRCQIPRANGAHGCAVLGRQHDGPAGTRGRRKAATALEQGRGGREPAGTCRDRQRGQGGPRRLYPDAVLERTYRHRAPQQEFGLRSGARLCRRNAGGRHTTDPGGAAGAPRRKTSRSSWIWPAPSRAISTTVRRG